MRKQILSFTILTIFLGTLAAQAQGNNSGGSPWTHIGPSGPAGAPVYPSNQTTTLPAMGPRGFVPNPFPHAQNAQNSASYAFPSPYNGGSDAIEIVLKDEESLPKAYAFLNHELGVGKFSVEGPKQTPSGRKLGSGVTILVDKSAFSRVPRNMRDSPTLDKLFEEINDALEPIKLCKGSLRAFGEFVEDGQCSAVIDDPSNSDD